MATTTTSKSNGKNGKGKAPPATAKKNGKAVPTALDPGKPPVTPKAPPMVERKQTTIPGTQPKTSPAIDAAALTARAKSLALNKARKEQTDSRQYLFALMEQEGVSRVEAIGDDNRRFGFAVKDGKKVLEEYTIDEDE